MPDTELLIVAIDGILKLANREKITKALRKK
jgi:hypothetical protein